MATSVDHAIVLAAGNGDRFHSGIPQSKLVTSVAGTPLLIRTLTSAWQAGITHAHLVLGFDADRVRALAIGGAPDGLSLHFHLNHNWHQENGISVLAARAGVADRPFALLMGDHIFEAGALESLMRLPRLAGEALIGVDHLTSDPEIVLEATKVRMRDGLVTAIGKSVHPFDALDTGLFVCDESLFAALDTACAAGDTTLSGGMARLAAGGLVRGIDLGPARWCDIDTLADLTIAEALIDPVHVS
jgi:1L-myo-inositol 1-phosphate cytidylyltransferase